MTPAVDQDVRDRVVRQVGRSFALSAGAGSGKTTVLTDRVVALLASGVPPRRIAAITFTEKAAGELQSRVRDALEDARAVRPSAVLDAALAELSSLTLSTIHAFCRQLLRAEALTAGWAPDTEILPSIAEAAAVRDAYGAWLAGFRARHPVAGLLVAHLVHPQTLRNGVFRLFTFRDLDPARDALSFDPERAARTLADVHADLERAAARCRNPRCKLLQNNAALRGVLADAVGRDPIDAVVRALTSDESGSRSGGRQGDWDGGKEPFKDAVDAWKDWRTAQLATLHHVVVTDLRAHLLPAVHDAESEAGAADFDGLLFRAAALLSDHDDARARLAARFDAVLVDEVQDTDPIQAEVAALLTRRPDLTGRWDAHAPEPGRLFAVGDPRQSIYRFRRADVHTWRQLRDLIDPDDPPTLTQNFRSVPGLVAWINATFADPWLPGYVPQVAHRGPAALDPVVRLPCDADDELDAVARYLHAVRRDGRVVDRDTGALRSVRWSDVMVLLPAWSAAEAIQATLTRAGIPCLVEGGGRFFDRDEVRLAMAALHCLDEPGDERATFLVLRGLFGIDWPTLAAHKAVGGVWRYTVPDPPPGPVADAFAVLRRLSRQRGRRPWGALLDALLDHTRAPAVWVALDGGEARLANLDKLRALLRQFEATARSPGEVLAELDALDRDKDLSRVDLDSDAVRITSYFKAKGLEAPIVVLCAAKRRSDPVDAVVDRRARQVAVKIGDLVLRDWDDRKEAERAEQDAERRRWMYVAATRARDQLVLADPDGTTLVRAHLEPGLPHATVIDPATLPAPPQQDAAFPGHDAAIDAWLAADPTTPVDPTAAWSASRAAAIDAATRACTRWRSVVDVATRERVTAAHGVGVRGGALVHDVMEALDLAQPRSALVDRASALLGSLGAARALEPDLVDQCATIVRRLIAHSVLDRARAAPERWTEVPFALEDGGRIVSGRIDLAFPTDASRRTWVVVDWKSDLPPRGTPAWRNYERQLGWYARALLQTVSPCEAVETVLVGPHPELAPPSVVERLGARWPALVPGLERWLAAGGEAPRVGVDLDGVVAPLVFDSHGVVVGAAVPGWRTVRGERWDEHVRDDGSGVTAGRS